MKKKIISLMLSAAMATTALVGCGSEAAAPSAGAAEETKTEAKADDASVAASEESGDKTKLTALFIAHALTEDLEEMKWLAEFEDKAGVDVEWEVIRADWDTVKSTRFASGDIPDIVFNATVDSDYTTYNGLFVDLTDYITPETTPNISAMFAEEPDTKTLATTLEGKIYGLPKFQGKWPATNGILFINKQWLDNAGLEVPTTVTEFKECLEAFKAQDVNGNGDPNDEIPFDFHCLGDNAWFNSAYSASKLITSLGIQLTDWGTDAYYAEDGKVKCYAVDDRYKELMKYLADLYAEGLINENAITNDYSTFQSLSRGNEAGEAVVGAVYGWEETDKFGTELYSQYVALSPLAYDYGVPAGTYDTRYCNDYAGLNMSANRAAISANCKNVEAALKFLDQFYGEDESVQVLFGGITDGAVEKTGDKNYKVLPPLDPAVDNGTWKWTVSFADNGPMYVRRACNIEMAQDMTYALEERKAVDDVIAKATKMDTYPQMYMKYTEADQNAMAVAQANINNIIDNQWALWLTGDQDIDSTWDAYVDSVNAAGLQDVLAIRQAAFDSFLAQ